MDDLARLLLRFVLVPLGYFVGVLAGTLVILFGSWKIGRRTRLLKRCSINIYPDIHCTA